MKTLLVAINAKYIHSNLAVYTLRSYAKNKGIDIELAEYTINNFAEEIMADIYKKKPDFIGFSCYIWNIEYVEAISRELKKVLPNTHIWYGGPEVSYNSEDYLVSHNYVDGIMIGEGEETLCQLIQYYRGIESDDLNIRIDISQIQGIVTRIDGRVTNTGVRPYMNMDDVPFVYNDLSEFENKIIYYESSRGCPYSCSYCMSSIDKRVRFRSMELVKKELQYFLDNKVSQVKFVDRTFNCNRERTKEIWTYIKEHDNGVTNFHFEVSADILTDEEIDIMKDMRPRLIQLEIGVQSTNLDTIDAIKRKMDFEQLSTIVRKINDTKRVHQHLDLIAGLPYEGMESFKKSFNDVYGLEPEQLQLGFLKVLKGSLMHREAKEYGIVYKTNPVYEVLYTKWLTYDEILELKQIEEMVEVYYNSRQFENTIKYLERFFETPFHMYESFAKYYEDNSLFDVKHSRIARYNILIDMCNSIFDNKANAINAKTSQNESITTNTNSSININASINTNASIDTSINTNASINAYVNIDTNINTNADIINKNYNENKGETFDRDVLIQLLRHDLYLREKMKTRPEWAAMTDKLKKQYNEFYKNEENIRDILPNYKEYDTKQIARLTNIEKYEIDMITYMESGQIEDRTTYVLYDYLDRNPINYQATVYSIEIQ